jgi:AmmeMemoRadiSam system protein A
MEHSFQVELAVRAIESYVKDKKVVDPPADLPDELKGKAGVFVSIKKRGQLRGCIGTFSPTTENIAREIVRNAIAASAEDPRFPPVREDELKGLEISVDVLTRPEKVSSASDLNAKKYGVIVSSGGRKGLLLPDLEGVNTPQEQIEICKRKAWISDSEPVELFKFEVKRFK